MHPILQANNVSRYFSGQMAVNKLSLTIERGEVMALLGTNGAGKTTTLRLLTGELLPDAGTVFVNQVNINIHPKKAKQFIGYLPDVPPLYNDLTVDEYLTYCANLRGLPSKETRQRVNKIKTFCELQSVSRRLIKKLSKGYQQRIGIAQAIVHKPLAVILDEPTNGLDPTQISEMRDLILDMRKDTGILLSTHQLGEVEQICDRVHLLKQGETIFCKQVDELQHTNSICMRFIKPAPAQLIEAHPEVNSVTHVDDSLLQIQIEGCPTQDHLDTLKNSFLAQAETGNWGMVEIYDMHNTLEEIFVKEVLRDKQQ